jgi:hypothetical protein
MKTRHNYHDAELVGCTYSRADATLPLSFACVDGEFVHETGPFAGVIVAICVFAWLANRARYTMPIDLIVKLEERFDSPQMRKSNSR